MSEEREMNEALSVNDGIVELSQALTLQCQENITILDLTSNFSESMESTFKFPSILTELNLSHNNLKKVPASVLQLKHLKGLDLSFNKIEVFDARPNFCESIERIDLSHNALVRPPYWVWSHAPRNLYYLKLSDNTNLSKTLKKRHLNQLLVHRVMLSEIDLSNCHLKDNTLKLLSTLPSVKKVTLGIKPFFYINRNHVYSVPCKGLDTLWDLERLIVCNTDLSTVNPNINMYESLIEINLSINHITDLPDEFCMLENLEICILSENNILCLPNNMNRLRKLKALYLDQNELCMIQENLCEIESLSILDLYYNNLSEIPNSLIEKLSEIDLAQNSLEEPVAVEYQDKKAKLRLNKPDRTDGRKIIFIQESEEESSSSYEEPSPPLPLEQPEAAIARPDSGPEENWDTDDDNWSPSPTWLSRNRQRNNYRNNRGNNYPLQNRCCVVHNLCLNSFHEMLAVDTEPYQEAEGQFDDYSSESE
ncbi:hypothetical protein K1T71_000131 [Dendrolimus kikuchii]|uniref:Uncharacterized protein n=1 Tax=Dendrolimus kikuchii TaxID=765133 RepID=A0ACC1DIB1_9NEOP|nr:hypothetical protein K1T71_000131 [Dendrolimus kikuchii]